MVQFFGGFESVIHTLRKESISSDVYKSFEGKKWLNKKLKPYEEC
jgi:hypothetical protein